MSFVQEIKHYSRRWILLLIFLLILTIGIRCRINNEFCSNGSKGNRMVAQQLKIASAHSTYFRRF